MTPAKSGKTNVLQLLLSQDNGVKVIFDSNDLSLFEYQNKDQVTYITTAEETTDFITYLHKQTEIRLNEAHNAIVMKQAKSSVDYFRSQASVTIYIDDIDLFISKLSDGNKAVTVLEKAIEAQIKIIATATNNQLHGYDRIVKFFKNTESGLVLGNTIGLPMFGISARKVPKMGNGIMPNSGILKEIKIAKYVSKQQKEGGDN